MTMPGWTPVLRVDSRHRVSLWRKNPFAAGVGWPCTVAAIHWSGARVSWVWVPDDFL